MNKKSKKRISFDFLAILMVIISGCLTISTAFAAWEISASRNGSITIGQFFDIRTLALDENAGVTFSGGSKTAELNVGGALPAIINNNQGKDIAGWYNVNDKSAYWKPASYDFELRDRVSNSVAGSKNVAAFAMPAENITIAPFFVEQKQRPIIPASQSIDTNNELATRVGTKFYETNVGTQIGAEFTYVGGAYSGIPGSSLTNKGFFRMLSSCATANGAEGSIGAEEQTFNYWFKNLGTETMSFKVYQGNSGSTIYTGANTGEITLAEGETWRGSITIEIPSVNANAVTFLVFSSDHTTSNADFAMVMSMNLPAKYNLTIKEDADVTLADGSKTVKLVAGKGIPEYINSNPGTDVAGWYDVNNPGNIWNQTPYTMFLTDDKAAKDVTPKFTMPAGDITIAPFFVDEGLRPMVTGSGNTIGSTQSGMTDRAKSLQFFETDIGTQLGQTYTYSGTNNGYFRISTATATANNGTTSGVLKAGEHTFYFWFKNMGTQEIKFQAYQVISGTTLIAGANTDVITLAPGASYKASIKVTLTATNNNAMTMIYLRQDETAAKLGIVMSKSTANEVA